MQLVCNEVNKGFLEEKNSVQILEHIISSCTTPTEDERQTSLIGIHYF